MDMLQRRLPTWNLNPSWCILCKAAEEDRQHLFSLCPFSSKLWKNVEVVLDRPLLTLNPAVLCKETYKTKEKTKIQTIEQHLVAATLWNIWSERNKRIFKGKKKQLIQYGKTFKL